MVLNIFPTNKTPDTTPYTTPYTTPDATPYTTCRHKRSEISRLNENFINEIKNDKKNINSEIFNEYFGY